MEFALEYAEETYNRFFPDNRGRNNRRNRHGDNQHGLNRARRMRLITAFVIRFYCIYLFIANLCLSTTQVEVTKLDVESLNVKYDIVNATTVKLRGSATIQTILKLNGDFTPTPELGVFKLTIDSGNIEPFSTFSYSTFTISENEKQLLVLNFEPHETQLPREKVMYFQEDLKKGEVWLRFDVKFQWQLNKQWFLVFPVHHKRTDFHCNIRYKDLPVDGRRPIICK